MGPTATATTTTITTTTTATAATTTAARRTVRVRGTQVPATFLGRSRHVWVTAVAATPPAMPAAA